MSISHVSKIKFTEVFDYQLLQLYIIQEIHLKN